MSTHYAVLGCEKSATYEELKRKYQELVRKYHPDKLTENPVVSSAYFLKVDTAWKILRDPKQRKLYDDHLIHSQLSDQPLIYASLGKSELNWNEENKNYSYLCRCGGMYNIEQSDIECEDCFVSCDDCSLIIHVIYDK